MDVTVLKHEEGKAPKNYRGYVEATMPLGPKVSALLNVGARQRSALADSVVMRLKFDSRNHLVDVCNKFFRVGGVDIEHQRITVTSVGDKANVRQMLEKSRAGVYDNRPILI